MASADVENSDFSSKTAEADLDRLGTLNKKHPTKRTANNTHHTRNRARKGTHRVPTSKRPLARAPADCELTGP